MNTPGDVIDREHLERATGGDAGLMAELLDMLLRDLPARKQQLDESLAARDFDTAAEAAHKLRGSGSYTGALKLERAAGRLEERLRARDEPGIREAMQDVESAMADLHHALRENAELTR